MTAEEEFTAPRFAGIKIDLLLKSEIYMLMKYTLVYMKRIVLPLSPKGKSIQSFPIVREKLIFCL